MLHRNVNVQIAGAARRAGREGVERNLTHRGEREGEREGDGKVLWQNGSDRGRRFAGGEQRLWYVGITLIFLGETIVSGYYCLPAARGLLARTKDNKDRGSGGAARGGYLMTLPQDTLIASVATS